MSIWLRSIGTALAVAVVVDVIAVVAIAPVLPRVAGSPAISEERVQRFAAAAVSLNNADGWVRVRTRDASEVIVHAMLSVYAAERRPLSEIEAYAASLSEGTVENGVLTIVGEPADRPDWAETRVNYDIAVPKGTDVTIRSTNGNVSVLADCGRVAITGGNSDVEVLEPRGAVTVETTTGRIRAIHTPQGATLRTVNGNIYAHAAGGSLAASTTNGAIVARLLNSEVRECRLSTQNGGVTAIVLDESPVRVDARTERGAVRCDLPVDAGDGGTVTRRCVQGRVLGGDSLLSAQTLNGNIWIARSDQ